VKNENTTTTITSDAPDPSVTGQAVTVNFTVAVNAPGSGTATGNVTVSDGAGGTCTATVAVGSCQITYNSPGVRNLTATYAGDSNFNGGVSASVGHTVNKDNTTTTITSDAPDPSVTGQAVTVNFTVAVNAPGSGTATGNVTVSDGTNSCTGTVGTGQCSITFSTGGTKSLTATFAGDVNFNGSVSGAETHQVNASTVVDFSVDSIRASSSVRNPAIGKTTTDSVSIVVRNSGASAGSANVSLTATLLNSGCPSASISPASPLAVNLGVGRKVTVRFDLTYARCSDPAPNPDYRLTAVVVATGDTNATNDSVSATVDIH